LSSINLSHVFLLFLTGFSCRIIYKIRKTRESRSLRFDWRDYWMVPHWKYCRIVNPITGSYAQIVQFSSVESKFIAFTNDARKRFWNMDWNVVLLLQVKRCIKPHKNHKIKAQIRNQNYLSVSLWYARFVDYVWMFFCRLSQVKWLAYLQSPDYLVLLTFLLY